MPNETYRSRLRQYERREHTTVWVAAGYGGLIALMTTKIFEDAYTHAPAWLAALLVTLVVVGAGLLASARVRFEWLATVIRRKLEESTVKETGDLPVDERWPVMAENVYTGSLLCCLLAALAMLMFVWWRVSG